MLSVRIVRDLDECRRLWKETVQEELISNLWEVRDCFNRQYGHSPYFVVAEERGAVLGLLPLSWNEETQKYNYFPGETWQGKTWLEQNRIVASSRRVLEAMLQTVPRTYHLRYLRPDGLVDDTNGRVDEVGYFFIPPKYDFDMGRYFGEFSHKTAKRLTRELASWTERGLAWRYDRIEDFQILVDLNLGRYGASSYFADPRFLNSFCDLKELLAGRGWLRITTALVDDRPAAVDLGVVYNGTYTLLAGGTHADYPGIAKLINNRHMAWACENRLERVDFLCGDFNWKSMFHLSPQPLYLLEGEPEPARAPLTLTTHRSLWSLRGYDVRGITHA